jgi:hypothetical protein
MAPASRCPRGAGALTPTPRHPRPRQLRYVSMSGWLMALRAGYVSMSGWVGTRGRTPSNQPGLGSDRREQECPCLIHALPEMLTVAYGIADLPVTDDNRDDLPGDQGRVYSFSEQARLRSSSQEIRNMTFADAIVPAGVLFAHRQVAEQARTTPNDRVVDQTGNHLIHQSQQLRKRVKSPSTDLPVKISPPLHHLVDDRSRQSLFGGEVEIQCAFGTAAVSQHALQRGGVVSIASEVLSCSGENRQPGGPGPRLKPGSACVGVAAAGSGSSTTGAGHDASTLLVPGSSRTTQLSRCRRFMGGDAIGWRPKHTRWYVSPKRQHRYQQPSVEGYSFGGPAGGCGDSGR